VALTHGTPRADVRRVSRRLPSIPIAAALLAALTLALPAGAAEPVVNVLGGGAVAPEAPIVGTVAELRDLRIAAAARAAKLELEVARLEAASDAADAALDTHLERYSDHMLTLFDEAGGARIQALAAVRAAHDADLRAELLAALDVADRPLAREYVEASDAVTQARDAFAVAQGDYEAAATRIEAIDAALAANVPVAAPDAAAEAPIDVDYVFATGPIPGIGYWGAAAGGNFLTGWTNMATASVGGIGCDSPDANLRATGQLESGEASWYGPGFHGNGTANGEVYDQAAMTAAHKTLPFGTIVRVYSTATARCAFVRINDRGPFVDGRIIDLSHGAATAIGLSGVASVQLEVWASPVTPP
jgi:hypothetical protein